MRPYTVAAVLFAALPTFAGCAPRPSYAWSPQWHAGRFDNPPEWLSRHGGAREALRWLLGKRPEAEPFRPPTVPNDGAALRANTTRYSLTWLGHATVLVQSGGVNVLTDPNYARCLGGVFCRRAPPGLALSCLPPVDVVLISHNHRDHLDEDSVHALARATDARLLFLVPLGLAPWFRAHGLPRVVELDWWQSFTVETAQGRATLTLVPAQHWSRRSLDDENRSLWGGWIIDAGNHRTFFAGDSGYPAAFREVGRRFPGIDVALLPIGAYEPRWFMRPQHMSPVEAATAFRELGARLAVGIHWGTFRLSDEPMAEPPRLFARSLGADAARVLPLSIGETWFEDPARDPAARK